MISILKLKTLLSVFATAAVVFGVDPSALARGRLASANWACSTSGAAAGGGQVRVPLLGSAEWHYSGKDPDRTCTVSNGSSSEVCAEIQFYDAAGKPIGLPQAGTFPSGGSATVPVPPGTISHVVTIVDCDPPVNPNYSSEVSVEA